MIQAYIVVILSKVLAFISAIYLLDYINKYIPDSFFTTVFVGAIIDLVLWFVWVLLITDAFNIKIDL